MNNPEPEKANTLPPIAGKTLQTSPYNNSAAEWMLDYYDGTRATLQRSPEGQIYPAWWNDTEEKLDRWLYLPQESLPHHTVRWNLPAPPEIAGTPGTPQN